ncbi:sialate O-acetylesterase [Altererythrobacter luteolus]|uniref:Sialate O-acetylesterase n=2 Tax=Pontixanthobacter luteolus TaxID=295089 RepID=A0A6I4V257_9SPHN|nr:sialate O-acetylesterase [Pontixanthobacter luteolus]
MVAMAAPTLGPAYGDGMVLQRDVPVVLEGSAEAGETVTARMGDATGQTTANPDGTFRLTLPARPASTQAKTLFLSDPAGSTELRNILVGDVFLCSGQSNMELPVNRALDTSNQLRMAADDGIRLFKVGQTTASVPQTHFTEPVQWNAASRDTVGEFSAACFYMAKQLRLDNPAVPVGLIHSNWGGSAARAWLAPEGVKALYGAEALEQLRAYSNDPLAATQRFVPQWYDWWREKDEGREPWADSSILDWQPIPKFSFWNDWTGTGLDTEARANVWLRQTITLTAKQAASQGKLSIGAIDDMDLTFVNGQPVGYTFGWGVERTYDVPAEYLRKGDNEILIAANNMWDTGGFFAGPDRLFFTSDRGEKVPLGPAWEYSVSGVTGVPPRAPWDANAGLGVMHNAMIAPLGPMRLAGAAWYQGEADVGQPDYDEKLRELFAGWRDQFGPQMKMMVVQLADFGERRAQPAESAWAQLRQDQLDGVEADADAILVTAIDIGEPTDIHPANKNVLGKRLAHAFAGAAMPMPAAAVRRGEAVEVTFTGLSGDLAALGGPYPLGIELCGAERDTCRWASPVLSGQTMSIPVPAGFQAQRVRHAWADAPVVNLYDARGMPVPGFELAITQGD